jgi:hypothetical protein
MSDALGSVLIVAGPVIAIVFALGVIALLAFVGYDMVTSRHAQPAQAVVRDARGVRIPSRETAQTRIYLERGVARAFLILAVVFWYQRGMETLLFAAALPFLMNLACMAVGWYWERTASVLLVLTSIGAVVWGIANNYEPGVWMLFTVLLIGPMLTAAVLYWMARQGEVALELRLALHPELTLSPVVESRD